MAEWSLVDLEVVKQTWRYDAEYWHPVHVRNEEAIARAGERYEIRAVYDLVERITGSAFYPSFVGYYGNVGMPFIRVADLGDFFLKEEGMIRIDPHVIARYRQVSTISEGDIVIAKGGSIGGVCVVQPGMGDCAVCRDVIALETDPSRIDSLYLVAFLRSDAGQLQLDRYKSQQVQAHLTFPALGNVKVVVPSRAGQMAVSHLVQGALTEQKHSKALYAEAEALLLAELELDRLDLSHQLTYTQGFSKVWPAGRLDSDYWGTEYTALVDYLEARPHSLLGRLAGFANGATPRGASYQQEGVPFLRIQNVGRNRLELDDVVYIDQGTHNELLKRSQLRPRDVLITITGRIGTSAVVPNDMPVGNINQHVVRMRLPDKETNPYYLAAFLNSRAGRLQTEREAYGTTREALPYYCLERVIVPEASEALQERIEAKIHEAEESLKEASRLLEGAKRQVEEIVLGEDG